MSLLRSALSPSPRRGVALLWALIVLGVVTVLLVTITRHSLLGRQWLERRADPAQALWLARAGVELASDRLLSSPGDYAGESAEIVPGSLVRIQVRAEGQPADTFLVTVEARYPKEHPEVVVRSLTRRLRRTVEKDRVRIEVLAAPNASAMPR